MNLETRWLSGSLEAPIRTRSSAVHERLRRCLYRWAAREKEAGQSRLRHRARRPRPPFFPNIFFLRRPLTLYEGVRYHARATFLFLFFRLEINAMRVLQRMRAASYLRLFKARGSSGISFCAQSLRRSAISKGGAACLRVVRAVGCVSWK